MKQSINKFIWSIDDDLHFFANIVRLKEDFTEACLLTASQLEITDGECKRRFNFLKTKKPDYFRQVRRVAIIQVERGAEIDQELVEETKREFPEHRAKGELLMSKALPALVKSMNTSTDEEEVKSISKVKVITISPKLLSKIEDIGFDKRGNIQLFLKAPEY